MTVIKREYKSNNTNRGSRARRLERCVRRERAVLGQLQQPLGERNVVPDGFNQALFNHTQPMSVIHSARVSMVGTSDGVHTERAEVGLRSNVRDREQPQRLAIEVARELVQNVCLLATRNDHQIRGLYP